MKIAVNALYIRPGVNGGTETYCNEICRRWFAESATTPHLRIEHFCTVRPTWAAADNLNYRFVETGAFRSQATRVAFEQLILPNRIDRGAMVFSPGYVGLLSRRYTQIITVHDAYAWMQATNAGRLRGLYWRWLVPTTVRRSAAVIAVSESTKRDLCRVPRWPKTSISVIHEAGDHVHRLEECDRVRRELRLETGNYFLAVGVFKSIKNPETLLAAYLCYRRLCEQANQTPRDLVMCGAIIGPYAAKIADQARGTIGVRLAGRVDDTCLKDLYSHAAGLVFVSKYEGFGIPILEAQELSCPVITANCSSMPEVAGDGALLVNPDSASDLAAALLELHDDTVAMRLRTAGASNCKKFTWQEAAKQTLGLFARIAAGE